MTKSISERPADAADGGAGDAPLAFDFFRKYQRMILYTAGIFALLSFSISGALLGFFDWVFRPPYEGPRMTMPDGRTIRVTEEDTQIGLWLARGMHMPTTVLPPLPEGENSESNVSERYAALRRLAIDAGIEVSDAEVDDAIRQAVTLYTGGDAMTPTQLALRMRHPSLDAYRQVVREAMRIGTYLRFATLATDTSLPALVGDLLRSRELVTLKVASVDKRKLQEAAKAEGVSDETLQAWLAALPETEQARYKETTNRVALTAAGILHAEFDASQWEKELAGKQYGEETLRQRYDRDREIRWRKPAPAASLPEGGARDGEAASQATTQAASQPDTQAATQPGGEATTQPDPYVPFEEARERVLRTLQSEDALRAVWADIQAAMAAELRPLVEARNVAAEAFGKAQAAKEAADQAASAKPGDAELKTAAETAAAEATAKEAELKTAKDALDAGRKAFVMAERFRTATSGRSGVQVVEIRELVGQDGLRDLRELGTWASPYVATAMETPGDLATQVQNTDKASFLFQLTDVAPRPLRPFADIKEQLTADWINKQADDKAKEQMQAFEDALLRLAKAQLGEAATGGDQEKKVDERLTAWREQLEASLAAAKQSRERLASDTGSRVYQRWDAEVRSLEQKLADADARRAEIAKEVAAETEKQVAAEARKEYAKVFEAAAAEAGIEVATYGPHPRSLSEHPRFHQRFPEAVRFLWFTARSGTGDAAKYVKDLKAGAVTEVLDDATNRTVHVALVDSVGKADLAALTRRDLLAAEDRLTQDRLQQALAQSFTIEALQQRFDYRRQDAPTPANEQK